MKIQTKHFVVLALVIAVLGIGNAFAVTATSNMAVSANVTSDCAIAAGPLTFNAYDPITANNSTGTDATTTATLSVACSSGATAAITLGQGTNPDGASTDDAPLRRMSHNTDVLSYNLYQDAGFNTVWGNSPDTSAPYEGIGTATDVTVFAVAPRGQNVPSGAYADTVVATITF